MMGRRDVGGALMHTIPVFAWGTEENNEVVGIAGSGLGFKPTGSSVPDATAPTARCKSKYQERKGS
jgi:hypothetical protein